MSQKLFIRVDMNQIIATGHVIRCLSIAEAAKDECEDVVFILADEQAKKLVESKGFRTIILNTKWNDLESELADLLTIINQEKIEILLIDSYYVTEAYLRTLNKVTSVAYIDDLNSFHYPADTLIVYANYWKKMKYEENYSNTKLLLGCSYVPLRKEFQNLPAKTIRKNIENLLIMTGGSDNFGIADNILDNLEFKKYKRIDVICGRYYDKFDYIKNKFSRYKNVNFQKAVENLIDYMLGADVAISAGGTTLYELCAAGTPTITYSLADNQLLNVHQFDADKFMYYVGDVRYSDLGGKIQDMLELYESKDFRIKMSLNMQVLVDGLGARRIIQGLFRNEYC